MIEEHANKHLDKIRFPTNQGKDYILERGKYTKMAYGRLQQNWLNAEDAVQEAYLMLLEYPVHTSTLQDFEALFTVVLNSVISRMYRNDKAQEKNCVTPAGKYLQYLEVEEDEDRREKPVALADEESNPETFNVAEEMLDQVRYEIGVLSFNTRNILTLAVIYGYKPKEIVEITGIKREKVYSDIKLFRKFMKWRIE